MTGVGAKVLIDGGCSPIVVPPVVVVVGPSLIVTVFVGTRPSDGAAAGSDAGEFDEGCDASDDGDDPFALVTVGDDASDDGDDSFALVTVGDGGCDASDDGEDPFALPTDPDDDVGAAAGELGSVVMMVPPYFPASSSARS
jgi:hypothetical protein